jgi:tRNA dimethylallyltransferase
MRNLLVIIGPTATGKTKLALRLAAEYSGEIINSDALQVYRGFDIGTAKPSRSERDRVRHHLVDILNPQESYSAGQFARLARESIRDIRGRGHLPIVVGGSGLYLRALLQGISPLPEIDPTIKAALRDELRSSGLESLYRELQKVDEATAMNLHGMDSQRILRALEVARSTGKPLSEWIREKPFGRSEIASTKIGLTIPRGILYDRIADRVRAMMQQGWLAEVQEILSSGVGLSDPAFQALGYRQLGLHLRGEISLEEALAETIRATRRFSKRQMTWFRKERDVTWFEALESESLTNGVTSHLSDQGFAKKNE